MGRTNPGRIVPQFQDQSGLGGTGLGGIGLGGIGLGGMGLGGLGGVGLGGIGPGGLGLGGIGPGGLGLGGIGPGGVGLGGTGLFGMGRAERSCMSRSSSWPVQASWSSGSGRMGSFRSFSWEFSHSSDSYDS